MLYPTRVLRTLGRSGDSLTELGANPHRVLRRWWDVGTVLARCYPDVCCALVRQLDQLASAGGGAGHCSPQPVEIVQLAARSFGLLAEARSQRDMMHAQTALHDLIARASLHAEAVTAKLEGATRDEAHGAVPSE